METDERMDVVILSAKRTPIGRIQEGLSSVPARELGATVVRAAVEEAYLPDLSEIDEVLMGNVVSAGLGQSIARQCAVLGGLPVTTGASTVNKVCGASLKTVMLAAQAIRANDGELFVAGGVESMSQAPHLIKGRLNQLKFGDTELRDALYVDGLLCPFEDWSMGNAAEFIGDEYDVTREEMDGYALSSHRKAIAAMDGGKFDAEITPVIIEDRTGQSTFMTVDESPRRDTSFEHLSKLKPAFTPNGKITPGNAPGLNDAAAALVISSKRKSDEMGSNPLARIVGYTQVGVEPKYIFDAPSKAIPRLLDNIGWTLADVDLIELNEAFAAQALANGRAMLDLGWDWSKVNVNGGAIALGHPLGATGARLLTTLLYALKDRGLRRGIASLCLGGGEAIAMAVETCS